MSRSVREMLISLGRTMENDNEAAAALWTWLPSYLITKDAHSDYACNFQPSLAEVMEEASWVLAQLFERGASPDRLSCCCDDPECRNSNVAFNFGEYVRQLKAPET
jgi:hypothetical protein